MNIMMTNMFEKSDDTYVDLNLGYALCDPDIVFFAEFVTDILAYYNNVYEVTNNGCGDRIDVSFDSGILAKYDGIPCDVFNVTLYRSGYELNKSYASNYEYTEVEDHRCLWVDLYYAQEDFDVDLVYRDIVREINNFKNRDFHKYLNEEYGK